MPFSLRFYSAIIAGVLGCTLGARAEIVLGPAAIAATVRDANGKAVAGARVVAIGPAERDGVTSSGGVVTLQALPYGTYSLRVTRAGFDPFDATLRIASAAAPTAIVMQLTSSTFANIGSAWAAGSRALGAGADPYAAHAVAAAAGTAIVPTPHGGGSGVSIDGASSGESRVELDGIPIAGGAAGFDALRFRGALPLADVSIVRGPPMDATTVRDTIGGVVDYRTPAISAAMSAGLDAGYDSAFGAFQHARYAQTFGNLGVLVDTVAGGGENRAQTVKARYAFSQDVSLAVASYGSQSAATIGGATVTGNAPAFAADLRASLGAGTLMARSFQSASQTSADGGVSLENARVRGFQVGYDVPEGANLLAVDYDRRVEDTTFADGTIATQTFSALTARADVALSNRARLELADSFESGTTYATRGDPRAALSLRASDRLTLRLEAGSAFAVEPAAAFATATLADAARLPETSVDLRLRADATLHGGLTAWGSAFETKRFDRPGGLPDARTAGVEVGIQRPARAGLGASAYVDVQDGIAAPAGTYAFDGVPSSKARVALAYRHAGFGIDFGTTLLGPNNAFGMRAATIGDIALRVPFLRLADVRLGIENLYGARSPYPALAPLFAPREFTFTVGGSPGGS